MIKKQSYTLLSIILALMSFGLYYLISLYLSPEHTMMVVFGFPMSLFLIFFIIGILKEKSILSNNKIKYIVYALLIIFSQPMGSGITFLVTSFIF